MTPSSSERRRHQDGFFDAVTHRGHRQTPFPVGGLKPTTLWTAAHARQWK
ncbi:hypothetical protein AQF52_8047 [Streptomyces venezuelae]|nr:hypothetical protein AQF52_8047 [Streptomyces venezuelae]